jgi:hypothetical protein
MGATGQGKVAEPGVSGECEGVSGGRFREARAKSVTPCARIWPKVTGGQLDLQTRYLTNNPLARKN